MACPSRISDLWQENTKSWDIGNISLHFDDYMKDILHVPIINADFGDELCWKYTNNGQCIANSAYKSFLHNRPQVVVSTRQSLSLVGKDLIMQAWKSSQLPPRVKTFAWRLIRRALASGLRVTTV
jgi:hypothetical protein